ncbi:MAG: hypothetical protein HYU73_14905 [Betaproteobacteria bacterium]|nr:hypothetical protein [Betaproteobacteria bacterium]
MKDYTSDIADFWSTILKAWQENRDRQPVIECNLFERKVLAYPAKEYINTLSERTRFKTFRQYEQVTAQGGLMVFINDHKKRILQSYIFNAEDIEPETKPNNRMQRTAKRRR